MKLAGLDILKKVNLSNNELDMLRNMYENKKNNFSNMSELKAETKFLAALTFLDSLEEMEDFVKNDLKIPSFNSKNRTFEEIKKMAAERLDMLKSLGFIKEIGEEDILSN